MLAVLALALTLNCQASYPEVTPSPVMPSGQPAYDWHRHHERHVAHLAHLHRLHVEHERDRSTVFILPVVNPGHGRFPPGIYSCHDLEVLWVAAGGRPSAAFLAAEIAEAESGGNSLATGPAGERGLWQINPVNGALSVYDPLGNARAAVIISSDGTDWLAWTTYVHGLYAGRC